jgi:hypothetical protein
MGKVFYELRTVGSSRYAVNYHDGVKSHGDGSKFFDIAIFSNKRNKDRFLRNLRRQGYAER